MSDSVGFGEVFLLLFVAFDFQRVVNAEFVFSSLAAISIGVSDGLDLEVQHLWLHFVVVALDFDFSSL